MSFCRVMCIFTHRPIAKRHFLKTHDMSRLITLLGLCLFFSSSVLAQASLSGTVRCANHQPMEGVLVLLSAPNFEAETYTNSEGQYFFDNLSNGVTYTVTPQYDDNSPVGITTLDILTGILEIVSPSAPNPFVYLAADMNLSGTVTTIDLVVIRQIILDMLSYCQNDFCWRFASEDYSIAPQNGSVDNIIVTVYEETTGINFIGVKLGDANFSACP